jgi:kynureninase
MKGFDLSIGRAGAPKHFAAHSHHPWPDVTLGAQEHAWRDAARLLDRKWDHIFGEVIPAAQAHIARQLALPDRSTIAFGPNTHSFVLRLLSCLPSHPRILTTASEFHSFSRQIARLEEDGLARVTRVETEPFDTFAQRFAAEAAKGEHDLVFLSHVFFDSGYRVNDLARIVNAVPSRKTFVVIDGYHAFMAAPVDFSALANRCFYLAGGYKYAMAGEGACFLHCPPGYGPRPRDTGWYAGFSGLESGGSGVPYARDGTRFLGATFDVSALYRFNAVQDWLTRENLSVAGMLAHVRKLEHVLLGALGAGPLSRLVLLVSNENSRGRFLAFRTREAAAITAKLAAQNFIVDHRSDRLRIGFGIYHDEGDAMMLAKAIAG